MGKALNSQNCTVLDSNVNFEKNNKRKAFVFTFLLKLRHSAFERKASFEISSIDSRNILFYVDQYLRGLESCSVGETFVKLYCTFVVYKGNEVLLFSINSYLAVKNEIRVNRLS